MNENNQPQSQQTRREPGYYWVKCQPMKGDIWLIALFRSHGRWVDPAYPQTVDDEHWEEIDERRIKRHSPTEQPGDAKHTPGPWFPAKWNPMLILSSSGDFGGTSICTVHDAAANAELIARAPDLLSEVSTLRSKQAELVAEMNRMKHYNLDAKREMASLNETIIALEAELEQLRSERDKMREGWKESKI